MNDELDLGYGGIDSNELTSPEDKEPKTNLETGKEDTGDDTTKIDNKEDNDNKDDKGKEDNGNDLNKETKEDNKDDDDDLSSKLVEGAKIEIGDNTYTVDKDKNLVDDKGNIFKEADKVIEYLKTLEQTEEVGKEDLNIDNIIEAVGIDIIGDDDNPVKFENTPEGIKQYINAVIETSQQEIAETALNTLYTKYPIVKDVLDYYITNGNSLEGFTGRQDRSNVVIDENDEAQQEAIIRTAWKEQNRKGSVDNYIAYLKSSGTLKTIAEEELEGLKQLDADYRRQMADEARAEQEAEIERQKQYWTGVKEVIDSKKIAGYKIPDTILIEREGKKLAATPGDFFNYIYRVDKEGYSQYQRDLMKETAESRRDDEILRAYLKFVGGNYSNLVDMAINEKQVNTLKFKAKEAASRKTTYKVTPPTKDNDKKQVDLGY